MPSNGTTSALLTSTGHSNTNVKAAMDTIDNPSTDITLDTAATSSARIPRDVGPPPSLQLGNRHLQELNMKCEADRRRTYERWPVPFMDINRLSAAGFYYTELNDVVRCAFCGVEVGRWEEGDDPFRDHQRWSASCGFIRGLMVGNIPLSSDGQPRTSSQETGRSYDVCGPYMELRPYSGPEQGSMVNQYLLTAAEMQKHGINQCRGPRHPMYNTHHARMQSYDSWPRSLKQKPDKLSEAGFYYTGKGDHTVCFHCGGGLKDWEDTDDPWIEHALWFPKCMHVVLVKGPAFVDECRRLKEARTADTDQNGQQGDVQNSQASLSSCSTLPMLQAPVSKPPVTAAEEKGTGDALYCQICFVEERGVLFLPCGHLVACGKCASSLSKCAVCRQPLTGTVRAFLS